MSECHVIVHSPAVRGFLLAKPSHCRQSGAAEDPHRRQWSCWADWLAEASIGHRERYSALRAFRAQGDFRGQGIDVARRMNLLLFEAESSRSRNVFVDYDGRTRETANIARTGAQTCFRSRPTLKLCLGFLHSYTKIPPTTMSKMSLPNPSSGSGFDLQVVAAFSKSRPMRTIPCKVHDQCLRFSKEHPSADSGPHRVRGALAENWHVPRTKSTMLA
ncbi:hypothetical protein BDV11DRAFT_113645 [Aspergillus similis]